MTKLDWKNLGKCKLIKRKSFRYNLQVKGLKEWVEEVGCFKDRGQERGDPIVCSIVKPLITIFH